MRLLVTFLFAALVFAPQAHSRITILPSDDTSGGATAKLGLTWVSSDPGAWVTANLPGCVGGLNGIPSAFCNTSLVAGIPHERWGVYSGRPLVTELACSTNSLITLTSTWTLRLAYRTGTPGSFTLFAGSIVFTPSDPPGDTKSLAINARPALADGLFIVTIDDVVQDAADITVTQTIVCTVN